MVGGTACLAVALLLSGGASEKKSAGAATSAAEAKTAEAKTSGAIGPIDAKELGRMRSAWSRLRREEKADVISRFVAEAPYLDTFQNSLLRYVRGLDERDLGAYPLASEIVCFDPKTHAPAQPIARRWVEADSALGKQARRRFLDPLPTRRLDAAYAYDYARREVVRHADDQDPDRIFANALAGLPPGLDVVEALVEERLDDGSQQVAAAAFAHAYTDRSGNAFRGVSLYDAWASGESMEMPDVDQLGIVHTCLGEWKRWKAPVSAQEELYAQVGDLFQDLHRHRGLRHALARSYAVGDAVLRDGYAAHLERFHALWDQASSMPAELLPRLPGPEQWEGFLLQLARDVGGDGDAGNARSIAGYNRRRTLEQDSWRVRDLLRTCLREETVPAVRVKSGD
jgi:hypothetical protein